MRKIAVHNDDSSDRQADPWCSAFLARVTRVGRAWFLAKNSRIIFFGILLVTFCFFWFFQVTRSAWCNDESAHIPAGLYHLETGRTDAYRVNPPLPRMIAALPLLLDRPQIDWFYSDSPRARIEYGFASRWIVDNHNDLRRYLFLARSTVLLFFVLGLWTIVRWAGQMYGVAAAWLAGLLWAFNPDVITHSAVVAPDLPAAASGLFAGYLFWDWLRQDKRPFPWVVAAGVALAILCKFSWLFLLVALPVVTGVYDWRRRNSDARERGSQQPQSDHIRALGEADANALRLIPEMVFKNRLLRLDAIRLLLSFSLTILIINWCYGFDGTGTRLGEFRFISESLGGERAGADNTGNRFAAGPQAWIPMPLPAEMIRGIDFLKWEFEEGMPCYLRGQWQHRGWWYFHLYAMAVKMPLGYWALIALGILSWGWGALRVVLHSPSGRAGRRRGEGPFSPRYRSNLLEKEGAVRDAKRGEGSRVAFSLEWLPILLAGLFIALVSSQTGFTHHVRYVLPAYGFLFLIAARVTVLLPKRLSVGLVVLCLSGTLWFHATHLGLAHTFFNPLAGGPNNGWRHLSFSNVDWGQSTYRMVDWVNQHPDQRPITVLFHPGPGEPVQLITDRNNVHTDWWSYRRSGWYLVSSFALTLERHVWLQQQTPVAQPYPDVLLYYVEDE